MQKILWYTYARLPNNLFTFIPIEGEESGAKALELPPARWIFSHHIGPFIEPRRNRSGIPGLTIGHATDRVVARSSSRLIVISVGRAMH